MRAVVFHGPGRLSVEEVPVPKIGPGELLVRVDAALTDGTDLKAYLRGHRLFKPPMLFGHEFVGTVVERGQDVEGVAIGDRVTGANSAPCRDCFYCRRGETYLCERLDDYLNWGAYAEYLRVPAPIVAQNLMRVSGASQDAVSPAWAAVEPLACVVHGADASGVSPGDSVVVLGATGAIGLMFVQVLKARGAAPVVAVGRSVERLDLARRLGADAALQLDDAASPSDGLHSAAAPSDADRPATRSGRSDLVESVRAATGGRGADVVFDATGLPEIWELAPDLCRRGGTAIMFGGCPSGTRFCLDTGRVHYDSLSIRGVFHHTPRAVRAAFELIRDGHVRIDPLIGETGGLESVESLLRRMARRELIKAVVLPQLPRP